jgi:hypothetical protein
MISSTRITNNFGTSLCLGTNMLQKLRFRGVKNSAFLQIFRFLCPLEFWNQNFCSGSRILWFNLKLENRLKYWKRPIYARDTSDFLSFLKSPVRCNLSGHVSAGTIYTKWHWYFLSILFHVDLQKNIKRPGNLLPCQTLQPIVYFLRICVSRSISLSKCHHYVP